MAKKRAAQATKPAADGSIVSGAATGLVLWGFNALMAFIAALVLSAAAVFLTTAWLFGPKIVRDRAAYAAFTASANGAIVDRWIALELDQSRITASRFWRA